MRIASSFSRNSTSIQQAYPLSDEQIMRVAPSVFAENAHESRSKRYTFVSTATILNALRQEGFQPFSVAQSRARDEGRRGYTKHMLRLRRESDIETAVSRSLRKVGDEYPEVIVVGSHDGTTSYQMLAGLLRLACLNGMVVSSGVVDEIRLRHSGDIVGQVIEGAYTVVKQFDKVLEHADSMKAIELNPGERASFARAALSVKYGQPEDGAGWPVTVDRLLEPRRYQDRGTDLWRTLNVVQENLVQGGVIGRTATGRRQRTRAVSGISQNVNLNRALWTLAEEMKRLKTVATVA